MLSVEDFGRDPLNIFTAHEFMGQVDPCGGIKMTVQFNLFGGTIFALHTERHKSLFPKIDDMSIVGCFCLTEPQSGSDEAAITTRAERDGDGYVLNGVKQFITTGKHADTAVGTVFASACEEFKTYFPITLARAFTQLEQEMERRVAAE
jgi:alkylation response protein AidB-like acyl-CoA dehydrogenase